MGHGSSSPGVVDFVGLLVAAVIGGFVGAGHDQHRGFGDERIETAVGVFLFAADLRQLPAQRQIGDDDEILPLRESGAGTMPRRVEDAVDGFALTGSSVKLRTIRRLLTSS